MERPDPISAPANPDAPLPAPWNIWVWHRSRLDIDIGPLGRWGGQLAVIALWDGPLVPDLPYAFVKEHWLPVLGARGGVAFSCLDFSRAG